MQRDLPRENVCENILSARLIHPKDRVEFHRQVNNVLNNLNKRRDAFQDFGMDFRIYATGRFYINVHLGYRVYYEEGGVPCRVTGFLQNITARLTENRATKKDAESQTAKDYVQLVENPRRYILSMIFNSKDTALTVQILLEIFLKHFNVNRAYVFWHRDGATYWAEILFDCVQGNFKSAEIAHNAEVRRRMRKKYQDTKFGRFAECSDTQNLNSEQARKIFQRAEIKSYLECAIMDDEKFLGCVGFVDCKNPRTWTKDEYEVLQAFADIMRRFLFAQLYYEEKKRNGSLWDF